MNRPFLLCAVCICVLFPFASVQAQNVRMLEEYQRNVERFDFRDFAQKAMESEATLENFDTFKSEFKAWIDRERTLSILGLLGLIVAQKNGVAAEEFISEIVEYIRSPLSSLTSSRKESAIALFEAMVRLAYGSDPKLYGKTLDGEDFDWESLRGKYVLIKFTATWCGPCHAMIPDLQEAYEKYHDKGLEIVSVYIWSGNEVEPIKEHVEQKELPWIILSDALLERVERRISHGMSTSVLWEVVEDYGKFYGFEGVPWTVLVDKDGKVIMMMARGERLQTKLAEIFE